MKAVFPIAGLIWVAMALGCSHVRPAGPTFDAKSVVEVKAEAFSAAVVAASASAWSTDQVEHLVSLYTADAVLFPPDGPAVKGKR
jgi:hypothetical protein